jgi:enoyl-CoA hydratase/carnithine racemase
MLLDMVLDRACPRCPADAGFPSDIGAGGGWRLSALVSKQWIVNLQVSPKKPGRTSGPPAAMWEDHSMMKSERKFVQVSHANGVGTIEIARGKVNALNDVVVHELQEAFDSTAADPDIKAVVFTGKGKFFSFGWDVPEFLGWERPKFEDFLSAFTQLYRSIFTFPKPVVCAINGHAMAGGCMLTIACDERLMVHGKAKLSLNEVTFGSAVPVGSTEMLTYWLGSEKSEYLLLSGVMLGPEQALTIGLVREVIPEESLLSRSEQRALELAKPDAAAYRMVKGMLRDPVAERMKAREPEFIVKFTDLWYSENTRRQLRGIVIR